MNYSEFVIHLKKPDVDGILQAEMGMFPFDGILDEDLTLTGYIVSNELTDDLLLHFKNIHPELVAEISSSPIPDKNWNEEWEKGFKEVNIGDFCQIRASFHEANPDYKHGIIINPKMAFGTGHHETTYMMIERMGMLDFTNKKVFDFGCGTGILSVLAAKLGAKSILGIDNEAPAIDNAKENSTLNKVNNVEWSLEPIEIFKEKEFDIILANINRTVLLKYLSLLKGMLAKDGLFILSGILLSDEQLMLDALLKIGFNPTDINRKGEWVCISAIRSNLH